MTQNLIQCYRQTGLQFVEDLGNGIKLEMVLIKGGTFIMGAPESEESSRDNERPQHEVTVPTFFMGKYQVTQAQWKAVAALPKIIRNLNPDPSHFNGDNRPVEQVNWYDAVEFCERLSRHTRKQYRLPSEAEWEYACRAGTATSFHFGNTITTDLANYRGIDQKIGETQHESSYDRESRGEYRKETTPVGNFAVANAFGLYDMHGNVWEWCLYDWHSSYGGSPKDGSAWFDNNNNLYQKSDGAVLRGGSWGSNPENCRSAFRDIVVRQGSFNCIYGFRIVCGVGKIL